MSDYSYDQGEENYYNNLLGRGKGDADVFTDPVQRQAKIEEAHRLIEQFAPKPASLVIDPDQHKVELEEAKQAIEQFDPKRSKLIVTHEYESADTE